MGVSCAAQAKPGPLVKLVDQSLAAESRLWPLRSGACGLGNAC